MWKEKHPEPRTNPPSVGASDASIASLRQPGTTTMSALGMGPLGPPSDDVSFSPRVSFSGEGEATRGVLPPTSSSRASAPSSSWKCCLMNASSASSTRRLDSSFMLGSRHTGHAPRCSAPLSPLTSTGAVVGPAPSSSSCAVVMHLKQNRCVHGSMMGLLSTSSQMGQQ